MLMRAHRRVVVSALTGAGLILLLLVTLARLVAPASADVGACAVFPVDNVWNTRIDSAPVHSNSANFVARIGASAGLHPDF